MDARLAIDTVVLLAYFVGIVALGLWAGRRNRNLEDFSLGSRSIPWWAVLASIIAAETSAATFLGTPARFSRALSSRSPLLSRTTTTVCKASTNF
ncbi:MAG: hypothetical protein DME49_07050 [Verrucomicrobia bacterium]|nr:MAG: hypothetical protein DME49_07050 [Verrucomicrobiota bacterium]